MKLNLELKLSNVYGGDGFTRMEKVPEQKLRRSKKKTITRRDIGVPVESDVDELRTEIVERDVQTFRKEGEDFYLRLGGPHGKLWGAMKSAAEILKDSTGEFSSFAEIVRAMRAINILPTWVKLEPVKSIQSTRSKPRQTRPDTTPIQTTVETLPQVLSGARSSMIVIRYDVIEQCLAKVEVIFPDSLEKKVKAMLKQIEAMGCLNKRRATITVTPTIA